MTKIDIFSGFLGAGKTTMIKKLLKEAFDKEKIVLIENEFGEIGIDGGFMKEAGVQVTEMNSGCICCSLVGDFGKALKEVLEKFSPDRIIIEPSGVGKLSDVIKAVKNIDDANIQLNSFTTIVDAQKIKMYMKNFGEFFNNQIISAKTVILSRSQKVDEEKLETVVDLIRSLNADATIITTPWEDISGAQILAAMEKSFADELIHEHEEHHHHDDDEECCCHHEHHHHDDDDDDEHEHHHHHNDDEEDEHEHHHHHDDDDEHEHHHHHDDEEDEHEHHHHDHKEHHVDENGHCSCGHDHHDHHHHHADEVFSNFGIETIKKFTKEEIENALKALSDEKYGVVLRAKGIVQGADGEWIHFDFVPEEYEVRNGCADVTGRMCVIGTNLKEADIKALFGV